MAVRSNSRRRRAAPVVACVALALAQLAVSSDGRATASSSLPVAAAVGADAEWIQPGGGGRTTDLALWQDETTLTVGGDVSGVFTGTLGTSSVSWTPSSHGFVAKDQLEIASVTEPVNGVQWAVAGKPLNSYLLGRTVDPDGVGPWQEVKSLVVVDETGTRAGVAGNGLPDGHPYCGGQLPARTNRPTGELVAVDADGKRLYVGTLDSGVRWVDLAAAETAVRNGTTTQTPLVALGGTSGLCVRDLLVRSRGANLLANLFIAAYSSADSNAPASPSSAGLSSGVFRYAGATGATGRLAFSPRFPEDLESGPNGVVYVAAALPRGGAAGGAGVWAFDTWGTTTTASWTSVFGASSTPGSTWVGWNSQIQVDDVLGSITLPTAIGPQPASNDVYIGMTNPPSPTGGAADPIYRETITITRPSSPATVTTSALTTFGRSRFQTGAEAWWLTRSWGATTPWLGSLPGNQWTSAYPGRDKGYEASDLVVTSEGALTLSGSSGVWHKPAGSDDFTPAMDGLGVTVMQNLTRVPPTAAVPAGVVSGNVDYSTVWSTDGFASDAALARVIPPRHPCAVLPACTIDPAEETDNVSRDQAFASVSGHRGLIMATSSRDTDVGNGQVWHLRLGSDNLPVKPYVWTPLAGPDVPGGGPGSAGLTPMAVEMVDSSTLLVAYAGTSATDPDTAGQVWQAQLTDDGTTIAAQWTRVSNGNGSELTIGFAPGWQYLDLLARPATATGDVWTALLDRRAGTVTWLKRANGSVPFKGAPTSTASVPCANGSPYTPLASMADYRSTPYAVIVACGGMVYRVSNSGSATAGAFASPAFGTSAIGPIDTYKDGNVFYAVGVTVSRTRVGQATLVRFVVPSDWTATTPVNVLGQSGDQLVAAGAISPVDLLAVHDSVGNKVAVHVSTGANGVVTWRGPDSD